MSAHPFLHEKREQVWTIFEKNGASMQHQGHPNERKMLMFWWIIDGLLDGDWRPLLFVILLVIVALAVGLVM